MGGLPVCCGVTAQAQSHPSGAGRHTEQTLQVRVKWRQDHKQWLWLRFVGREIYSGAEERKAFLKEAP